MHDNHAYQCEDNEALSMLLEIFALKCYFGITKKIFSNSIEEEGGLITCGRFG